MAPWWLRPTAEGPAEGAEKEAGTTAAAASDPLAAAPAMPAITDTLPVGEEEAVAAPLTGEGEELPEDEGEETEGEAAAPAEGAPEKRPRRRRGSRGRGSRAAAATAEAESAAPATPELEADPERGHVHPRVHAQEPLRLRPLRDERPAREERPREMPRPVVPHADGESISLGVPQLQDMIREIVSAVPERASATYEERKLALFCDLENVAIGARDSGIAFDINLVLERLLEKGKIIVKKAYADWSRYGDYKRPFHEAGIELIDIPQRSYSGKNSADIKMVVDAMDLSYAKEHLDTFVLLSGDSDFSPLVSKLKENDKYVIGCGVKNSSSNLLIDSCDEFIYYEDIWRDVDRAPKLDALPKKEQELFALLIEAVLALTRENKDVLWGSMIKQTMQRKRPSFSEGYYGYSTFSELLEDAEKKSIVKLNKDQRSGSYIVSGFAGSKPARGR
jgi:uncharacterized protein (TIGR00288 family)